MAAAARDGLAADEAIRSQVRRMLADKSIRQGIVENFAGQWLQTRRLAAIRPDPRAFPTFDEPLRQAMKRETLGPFESLVRDDPPVTRLLDATFTFVNERLARHEGLPGVDGEAFRRVSLADTPRRPRHRRAPAISRPWARGARSASGCSDTAQRRLRPADGVRSRHGSGWFGIVRS